MRILTRNVYKIEDYKDKIINSWKVLSYSHIDNKGQQYWLCECKCGFQKSVRTSHLMRGISKSCLNCRNQSLRNENSKFWKGGEFISATLFTRFKLSAKDRKIPFNISIKDMENQWKVQEGKCFYTDITLTLYEYNRDINFNASLDRKDSNKGYEIDNIQWVLKEINIMKMDLTEQRFLKLCKLVSQKGGTCGV